MKSKPSRYVIMKLSKNKKRILKTRRVKMVTFKGIPIRTSNDFSVETLQSRRE